MIMEYRRYGSFHYGDYLGSWLAIVVLLVFVVGNVILDQSRIAIFFLGLLVIVQLRSIIEPNRECFSLGDDVIIARKGKHIREIVIPQEPTIVISYADICPPLAVRTAIGNETHILRDKYAVSILQKMPLDSALEILHRGHIQKYTTSTIEIAATHHYIYSFVCDQELLDSVLHDRDCRIIIPKSLIGKVSINNPKASIYIDSDC